MRTVQIAPSLLSANYAKLGSQIKMLYRAGAQRLHIDIMDGHFVPNLSISPAVIKDLRPYSKALFDVHLMVEHPMQFIAATAKAGTDTIIVHVESADDVNACIAEIKKYKCKAGISLSPQTPLEEVNPYLEQIDFILLMTVQPGAGGQKFLPNGFQRIDDLSLMIGNRPILLCVDGGVTPQNSRGCVISGADILVSGSYIFGASSVHKAILDLQGKFK